MVICHLDLGGVQAYLTMAPRMAPKGVLASLVSLETQPEGHTENRREQRNGEELGRELQRRLDLAEQRLKEHCRDPWRSGEAAKPFGRLGKRRAGGVRRFRFWCCLCLWFVWFVGFCGFLWFRGVVCFFALGGFWVG